METCVVVAQQRTQYESSGTIRRTSYELDVESTCFREVNCRSFLSRDGLLPTPLNTTCTKSSNSYSTSSTPVTTLLLITSPKSAPIRVKTQSCNNGLYFQELSDSERWAGPTYCNSPPPSSVPIPKFSTRMQPTRTVSLELPVMAKEVLQTHPLAKSAPSSPRKSEFSANDLFGMADNATMALRRILNLDIS